MRYHPLLLRFGRGKVPIRSRNEALAQKARAEALVLSLAFGPGLSFSFGLARKHV
jgi:hypothetical protein